MAKTRRAYTGGAASTTTSSNILSSGTTSFTITAYTGWPYGSDPFFVVVEPGTANEEKILVTRTGSTDTTINVYATPSVAANRGADGTSSVAHSSGVTVFPVFTALDADEANELASSWSTKGDLVSYGSSTFETLGVGSDDAVLIADSGEASGLKWGSVDTAQLADDAVTTAKIDDDAVTSPKISLAYADSSARTTALPSPAEGDLSYLSDTDTLEVYDGSAWAAVGVGKILQVVSTTKTDTFSASVAVGAVTDVTGLSATITPSAATSKILVIASVHGSNNQSNLHAGLTVVLKRASTQIRIGDAASNRLRVTASNMPYVSSSANSVSNIAFNYLDSPNTTSATTYQIEVANAIVTAGTATIYVNRSSQNADANYIPRPTSTITVMEVSA